jgi:hypothetical protein
MSMPALADYLSSLRQRGVRLWVDNGQLRYHASKGTLSKDELARLRVLKKDIVIELTKLPVTVGDESERDFPMGTMAAPVSFQQRWMLSLTEQHEQWQQPQAFAFHLTGLLDPRVLERSIATVVCRHDSLRCRVVNVQGLYGLEITPPRDYQLDVVPVPEGLADEEGQYLRGLIVDLVARCADPAVGPMLYAKLLRISEQEHYLILVVHRLAADCAAVAQVFRELWLQYGAELQRQRPEIGTPSGQYRDYTLWQQTTDVQWHQKHAAYWQEYLSGAAPIQWPRDNIASCGECSLRLLHASFGATLSARLRELGRQTQSLPALVMLSLYVSVISRWCGQRDFVVPFNVAGRHAAHDGVVGCFAHVLYLRLRLKGDERFLDLLRLVSDAFYKAVFHQDFGRVALNRPDLLRGTFCQWLSWHPAELGGQDMYDVPRQLGISARPVHFQTASDFANVPPEGTDLDACFFDSAGDIGLLLIFRQDRFAEGTLERFIQELRITAERIVIPP